MQIYLVGGAVRDKRLNYPVVERDWVVVGSSPDAMLALGYKHVGNHFPVFLHPVTGEEYALARTEKKTGPGYAGFDFSASADVSLEEDLSRRDLTINAMAEDERGDLIDPYGGEKDLQDKWLRHVSPAFQEDPVRVLRVARFAARYAHLGFSVAEETMTLMRKMVQCGEVDHLVAERVWKEMSRAMMERHPEVFFETLRQCGALQKILPEIDALFGVPQRAEYHPEIDTGVHTMMVLQQATMVSDDLAVRFAALTHDVGKALTAEELLPRHHGHEEAGVPVLKALCKRLAVPNACRDLALLVCEGHLLCHRAQELKPSTLVKKLQRWDAFRQPQRFEQFLLACEADSRGRTGFEDRSYPSANYLRKALSVCMAVDIAELRSRGFEGAALGEKIMQARIAAVSSHLKRLKR